MTTNVAKPAVIALILKDEDEVKGQIVGTLYFKYADGTYEEKSDGGWCGERYASRLAKGLGVSLIIN